MCSRDQPTPPFNSPYQNAIKPSSMLQSTTYPSPARSDSEPSKYPADGLGLYSYSHSFATSGPSVTSGLYTPSPQPTEPWAHMSAGTTPLINDTTTEPWHPSYDHQQPHSPPSWDPHAESHRSSMSFSREGSELPYPQIKLEGGHEYEHSSPPMIHPIPMTVSPEHLTTATFPYEHSYGSPSMPRFESSADEYEHPEFEHLSYEVRSQSPHTRGALVMNTARTRRRRNQTTTPDDAAHKCEFCHKTFPRKFNRNSHMLTHDENRKKDHKCPYKGCDKQFVRKTDLDRHENSVHKKLKDFKCGRCDARFARKDTLRRHVDDGCPRRNEVPGPHLFRPMRTGVSPSMPYYHSPRPDMYDARASPLFRDDSFPGTPSGY